MNSPLHGHELETKVWSWRVITKWVLILVCVAAAIYGIIALVTSQQSSSSGPSAPPAPSAPPGGGSVVGNGAGEGSGGGGGGGGGGSSYATVPDIPVLTELVDGTSYWLGTGLYYVDATSADTNEMAMTESRNESPVTYTYPWTWISEGGNQGRLRSSSAGINGPCLASDIDSILYMASCGPTDSSDETSWTHTVHEDGTVEFTGLLGGHILVFFSLQGTAQVYLSMNNDPLASYFSRFKMTEMGTEYPDLLDSDTYGPQTVVFRSSTGPFQYLDPQVRTGNQTLLSDTRPTVGWTWTKTGEKTGRFHSSETPTDCLAAGREGYEPEGEDEEISPPRLDIVSDCDTNIHAEWKYDFNPLTGAYYIHNEDPAFEAMIDLAIGVHSNPYDASATQYTLSVNQPSGTFSDGFTLEVL